jgi:DNA polymerase
MADKTEEIKEDLRAYLEYLQSAGIEALPRREHSEDEGISPPQAASRNIQTLEMIQEELAGCKRCKLHRSRRTIVFGEGNPKATLMFIGEGPGYDEDVQGRPFVGAAGQLLTKIIESINLRREEVYIANIVKCRPPGNRNPQPDEVKACLPFLFKQIEAIGPQIICALGTVSAQALLDTRATISSLRGKVFDFRGIRLLPTFHPAYLLRNPDGKKAVWEDMKQIRAWLNELL